MAQREGIVRVGAIGDLHYTRSPEAALRDVLTQAGRECDVLVLCGDLTDHGLAEEAAALAREVHAAVNVPVIAVLGNHDFEGGRRRRSCGCCATAASGCSTATRRRSRGGVRRGEGFCGGFGRAALGPGGSRSSRSSCARRSARR